MSEYAHTPRKPEFTYGEGTDDALFDIVPVATKKEELTARVTRPLGAIASRKDAYPDARTAAAGDDSLSEA